MKLIMPFLLAVLSTSAIAKVPEPSEFQAAGIIGNDIGDWVTSQKDKPANVGVFSVHVNPPLDEEFAATMETNILKGLVTHGMDNVTPCPECRGPQVVMKDDHLVVTKGVPDAETLKRISKDHPVDAFITADVYRTSTDVIVNATMYRSPGGQLINAETFKVPALTFSDSSVQVLLTYGVGNTIRADTTDRDFASSASLSLLEELGFAKGGLNLGTVIADSNLIYLDPTLEFRGRFGRSGFGWSLNLGVGYGFNSDGKGLTVKATYELYFGSLTNLGIEGIYFMPQDPTVKTLTAYLGVHIGLSFGR